MTNERPKRKPIWRHYSAGVESSQSRMAAAAEEANYLVELDAWESRKENEEAAEHARRATLAAERSAKYTLWAAIASLLAAAASLWVAFKGS